ncbi:MAG: hypothetical protein ABI718_00710 [Acidobacteriota bacterium]
MHGSIVPVAGHPLPFEFVLVAIRGTPPGGVNDSGPTAVSGDKKGSGQITISGAQSFEVFESALTSLCSFDPTKFRDPLSWIGIDRLRGKGSLLLARSGPFTPTCLGRPSPAAASDHA